MTWEPTDEALEMFNRYLDFGGPHFALGAYLAVDAPRIAERAAQAERGYIARCIERNLGNGQAASWIRTLPPRPEGQNGPATP